MRLKNSTDFDNRFLRRLVGWCCRQLELPAGKVREVAVTNCRRAWRGRHLGGGHVLLRIGPAGSFPTPPFVYKGADCLSCADRLEGLVSIAAHELAHVYQYRERPRRVHTGERLEPQAVALANMTLAAFRAARERLVAEWSAAPERQAALAPPKPSIVDQRAAKAAAALARWQRKAKLAQTKVRQYKRRCAYYARKAVRD